MIRLNDIVDKVNKYNKLSDSEAELIKRAYIYSAKVHAGQKRFSGEPYLSHPLEVSAILADMNLDIPTIATGLLHDTVEDTLATIEEVKGLFGNEIASLVGGTTKISKLRYVSRLEKQAESFRKLILATAKDVRVVLIKLADRLHNMRTLEHLPEERRKRISKETMEIYAPLAHRLGINWLASELEDLSFKFSNPDDYVKVAKLVSSKRKEWKNYLVEVKNALSSKLEEAGIKAEVTGRFKHNYGIYRKMISRGKDFDKVYDILAFRIITNTENECYQALGTIHTVWKPIPGRIKDYIALPKNNGYQSLHTTVIGPLGEQMEIQIRTEKMHKFAEYGIAAHWIYKEVGVTNGNIEHEVYSALRQLIEHQDIKDPTEFIEAIKGELISNVVYVFTPDGDLIELPEGATPLDFAYSIHTDIGNQCSRAFVNRNLVPLDFKLKTGDTVEIVTSNKGVPNRDWLKFVTTSKAKTKIRNWLRKQEKIKSEEVGKSICERKFKDKGIKLENILRSPDLSEALRSLKYKNIKEFYRAVGFGKVSANELLKKFDPQSGDLLSKKESRIEKILDNLRRAEHKNAVLVKGYNNILIKFAKCCSPLPGENIAGFITRGKGITVHRYDCSFLIDVDPERKIEVKWDKKFKEQMPATLSIVCLDRPGMLSKLTNSISNSDVNIVKVEMDQFEVEKAKGTFDIVVNNIRQLDNLIHSLKKLNGVLSVDRVFKSTN